MIIVFPGRETGEKEGFINSFKTILKVPARNSGNKENYVATDIMPVDGNTYYRLFSVDKDGRSSYSKIVIVNTGASESFSFSVNSSTKQILIAHNHNSAQTYQYSVLNMNGQLMQKGQLTLNTGLNEIPLNATITRGIYVVQVSSSAMNTQQIKTGIF